MENLKQLINSNGTLSPAAIKKDELNKREIKTLEWSPFRPIPNVRKFRVELKDHDPLFKKYNIKKRLKPSFHYEKYVNNSINRYIEHQLMRLKKSNSITYWRIAEHLMKNSNSFLVSGINHVLPRWHRNLKLNSVISIALETKRIASNSESKLDFRRVYIEKANGKLRPLGVPKYHWRIYLHMMNNFIVKYLEDRNHLPESQHGFRPNKGTLSAWKEVLNRVITARDVYEFDLRNFFPNVNLDYISDKLLSKDIPKHIVDRLYYINCCSVKLPRKIRLNEFEDMMKRLIQNRKYDEVITAPRPLSYLYRIRGVPQGAPTSPVLSSLALEDAIINRKGLNCIMYADDGLYYGDIDQPIITPNSHMVSANIYFNLEKSGWVKKDGKWLKPLKFLGLEFDGETLKANTRKGSSLIFDKQELVMEDLKRTMYDLDHHESGKIDKHFNWEDFLKSELSGFISSRLYQGSWNIDEFIQSFKLTHIPKSYVYNTKNKHDLTVFNSTSYASKWLVDKLKTL